MSESDKEAAARIFHEFDQINFGFIIFLVALSVVLTLMIQKLLPRLAERMPGRFRFAILPLIPALRLVVLILTVFTIIPQVVRPTVQNFVAIFGALGLALGFAFKDYVSSLIAGIVAVWERPYRPGDWVRIDDVYGEVQELGLRALQIRTPDDTLVSIPHGKIWSTNIYNANSGRRDHMCVADIYLHPAHDPLLVQQRLMDVILSSPYLQVKQPVSLVVAEKPWGTHYRLKAYPVDGRDEFAFVTDLTVRAKAALLEAGVKPASAPAAVEL